MTPFVSKEFERLARLIAEQANRLFHTAEFSAELVELHYKIIDYQDGKGLMMTITASLRKPGSNQLHFQVNVLENPLEALETLLRFVSSLEPEVPESPFNQKVLN